jgi:hypothetical protein
MEDLMYRLIGLLLAGLAALIWVQYLTEVYTHVAGALP